MNRSPRPAAGRARHAHRRAHPQTRHFRGEFYVWKNRFGKLGTPGIREVRQLREENTKLKQVVADLTLDSRRLAGTSSKEVVRRIRRLAVLPQVRKTWQLSESCLRRR